MIELYIGIVGLFIGSFLNVLADRLPRGETILGRSKCEACAHTLSWKDLIPILSFAYLKAKCRYCKAPLSWQYPFSELLTSVLFVLTWHFSHTWYRADWMHFLHLGIVSVLIVLFLADLRTFILPDEMQTSLLLFGLVRLIGLSWGSIGLDIIGWGLRVGEAVLHGAAVGSPLLIIFLLTKGKGMGFGDVKFMAIAGFMLGITSGFLALYIGFLLGGLVAGMLLLTRKKGKKSMIPFGPFLIIGVYAMLFFEHEVTLWLLRVYGF